MENKKKITLKRGYIDLALDPLKKHDKGQRQHGSHVLVDGKKIGLFIHIARSRFIEKDWTITHEASGRGMHLISPYKQHLLLIIEKYLLEIYWLKEFQYTSEYYKKDVVGALMLTKDILFDLDDNKLMGLN